MSDETLGRITFAIPALIMDTFVFAVVAGVIYEKLKAWVNRGHGPG
jgi:hypothetical protein